MTTQRGSEPGTRYAVCVVNMRYSSPRAACAVDPLCESWWCDLPGPDETLPPYSNAPFAKARVRCSRVCAGAESGVWPSPPVGVRFPSPLWWRGYAPPLTGAGVFECACLGLLRLSGGRPLSALWGRGYRFAAALAAWIALRTRA